MNKLPKDTKSILAAVKGKKPIVVIGIVLAIALGTYAVQKGYISESLLNDIVTHASGFINDTAVSDTTTNAVDSLAH